MFSSIVAAKWRFFIYVAEEISYEVIYVTSRVLPVDCWVAKVRWHCCGAQCNIVAEGRTYYGGTMGLFRIGILLRCDEDT